MIVQLHSAVPEFRTGSITMLSSTSSKLDCLSPAEREEFKRQRELIKKALKKSAASEEEMVTLRSDKKDRDEAFLQLRNELQQQQQLAQQQYQQFQQIYQQKQEELQLKHQQQELLQLQQFSQLQQLQRQLQEEHAQLREQQGIMPPQPPPPTDVVKQVVIYDASLRHPTQNGTEQ